MTRHIGDDMKMGLARLVGVLTSVPNIDYAAPGFKMTTPKVVDLSLIHI